MSHMDPTERGGLQGAALRAMREHNRRQKAALSYMDRLPTYCITGWCKYKGETCVAQFNLEASMKAGKPMLDLSYCMTQALNQNVLRTVQYDAKKFTDAPEGQRN